ncbi:MAG: hypothetical protein SF162_02690 [bacterium]|nr:hypothetical protein [bacterium]
MKRKFGLLGVIAALLQVGGVVTIAVSIGLVVAALIGTTVNIGFALAQALSIVVAGLTLIAFGGVIAMVREIEFNTRRNAYYTMLIVRGQRARQAKRAAQQSRRQRPATPPPTA